MSYTLTVLNTTQSNFAQLLVDPTPNANPEDLVWTSGGDNLTIAGANGVIFPDIIGDQVNPSNWYHGGNPPLDLGIIEIHDQGHITISNTPLDVISDQQQKGVFELRQSDSAAIFNITAGSTTRIQTLSPVAATLVAGDYVELQFTSAYPLPGVYKVAAVTSTSDFTIAFNSNFLPIVDDGIINKVNYFWDEVYTTPLGLYKAIDESNINPGFFEFLFVSNNLDEVKIYINDPNIIPKVDDSIVIQKFFQFENTFTNASTTDGVNNVKNYSDAETYEFKITAVSALPDAIVLPNPYIEYTLVLDKSFKPTIGEKYMFVLLNRKGTTVDRELFTDTWKLTQVYRSQLLGDPYNYTGGLEPTGRMNYLYYKGAELLGVKNLLTGVLPEANTPFVVLDFADEVKDKIYNTPGEFEAHFPTVMLQGERTPVILTNSNPTSLISPTFEDTTGAGTYSALYLKYSTTASIAYNPQDFKRYGWVFYDLRIVVIDDAELATVLGYNANRNYTLPTPTLPTTGNQRERSTPRNPMLIIGATNTSPIEITTIVNHNLSDGDFVHIEGITGNTAANSPNASSFYFAQTTYLGSTSTTFKLYATSPGVGPVVGNGVYSGGGLMFGKRLPFEHFYTYRIKGIHYDSLPYADVIPFNWQRNGVPNDSSLATLDTQFDFLTHLVDLDIATPTYEGFEANQYEVIIGEYVQSLENPYLIDDVQNVVVMPAESLKLSNVQISNHTKTYTKLDYLNATTNATLLPLSDPANPKYDLLNVDVQKIYNLSIPLPETLFTSEGEWLKGLIKYKAQATQYRAEFQVTIPADKWNGTQNPSFEDGNQFMSDKLITEIEFLIDDISGSTIDSPYIYTKISPPIKKNNLTSLTFKVSIDF